MRVTTLTSAARLTLLMGHGQAAAQVTRNVDVSTYTLEAKCDEKSATASYTVTSWVKGPFYLENFTVSYEGSDGAHKSYEYEIGDLPRKIRDIEKPFVESVYPICDQSGSISFSFFVASKNDPVSESFRSEGKKVRLYFQIHPDEAPLVHAVDREF